MLTRVTKFFAEFAPIELGESWDNVGCLVENPRPNKSGVVAVTIDLTPAVLEEFLGGGGGGASDGSEKGGADDRSSSTAEVIIAYHPPLFSALKKFQLCDPKQRIILETIAAGASIYSPHTCIDSCRNSINDWLVESAVDGKKELVEALCPISSNTKFNEKLTKESNESKQKKDAASSDEQSSSPTAGNGGGDHKSPASPTSPTSVFDTVAVGSGRIATLTDEGLTLDAIVSNLKKHLEVPTARVSLPYGWSKERKISKIAVCAGSGASLFRELKGSEGEGVELLISGEMGHHDVLAANDKGCAVVLFEHTNSERGYLKHKLVPLLREKLGDDVKVVLSQRDKDPLVVW